MLTFRVEGGFRKVKKIINNLKLASHLANLGSRTLSHLLLMSKPIVGDAKTLVFAPFITIQAQITPEERLLT
jgi:O-acetylhomoserine/O-acetylserine sulfhydrylase